MEWLSPTLMKTLYEALEAFGAGERGSTAFARYWNAVGPVEDYAAVADTPAQRHLVQLLRWLLERELWRTVSRDALHPDARGVEDFLDAPPQRPRLK
jgi:hypothetical protein